MNLNSILIGSEDPKRLTEYYTKLFGKPAYEAGDFSGWQIGSGRMTVGPHDQVKGKNTHPGRVIWNIEADRAGDQSDYRNRTRWGSGIGRTSRLSRNPRR